VHANSAADALVRLASMAAIALGQSHPEMLSSQIRAAVDVVLHLERNGDGKRQLCSIHRLQSQSTQHGAAASMQRLWPKPDGMSQHPYRSQVANAHRKPEPDGA